MRTPLFDLPFDPATNGSLILAVNLNATLSRDFAYFAILHSQIG
jgi:hypothetical protein